jgi:hypothetical protein
MRKFCLLLMALLILPANRQLPARESGRRAGNLPQKVLGSPTWTKLNINHLSTNIWQDGYTDGNGNNPGLIYPKGSGIGAVFAAGLIWGARADTGNGTGDIRIGGSAYASGLSPGRLLDSLQPESPDLPKNRIYRVRPDIPPGNSSADISSETADGEGDPGTIYGQYHTDWTEWPWHDGAPFDDKNKDGIYDPAVDVPGVPGADQTIWCVACDEPGPAMWPYFSPSLGMEIQTTYWGYRSEGALGYMYFRRYVLINRNSFPFDSMYVALWADVDLGNPGDDLLGCDTTRSIGFVYNGQETDRAYTPLPPPAVGFDFFQGPIVPGAPTDSAIFKGSKIHGKRNLPMTAFFANTNSSSDPVMKDPLDFTDPIYMYRALQGLLVYTEEPFVDPTNGLPTRYPFNGDPEKRTGWLDGTYGLTFGDRRMGVAAGPFTMAPGDTQEIVVAEICAGAFLGCDRISAVGLLKFYDDQAQDAYDNFFAVPRAPTAPRVAVSPLNNEIVLEWGSDSAAVAATEVPAPLGYSFEGYNVYQLPSASASLANSKRLVTFDVANGVGKIIDLDFDPNQGSVFPTAKQYGTDSGIQRWLNIKTDAYNNNYPLVNGTPYYFAVTAYNYNSKPGLTPSTLESSPVIFTVIPHSPDPGVKYSASYGDTLTNVTHTSTVAGGTLSNGHVVAQVISPSQLTGATYKVVFGEMNGQSVWHVVKTLGAKSDTVARNITDQTGSDAGSPIVDGIIFRVFSVTPDFVKFTVVANANGPLVPPDMGTFAFNSGGFPTLDGNPPDGVNDRPSSRQQVGGGKWGVHTGGNNQDYTYVGRFIPRTTRDGTNWPTIVPFDFEIRFTAAGGKGEMAFASDTVYIMDLPFELWNTGTGTPDDASDDYRMIPWINDVNRNGKFDLDGVDNTISGGDNDPETDWIYWYEPVNKAPGHAGYDAWAATSPQDDSLTGAEVMARMVLVNWNGGSVSDSTFPSNVNQEMPEPGTVIRIETSKPNRATDVFSIASPATTYSAEQAKADVSMINVFPNPYYGVNPQELNKYQRFVTFNHLPRKATIRIFNLAGVMVRTINRESDSQFEQWDLKNDSNLPVGSGLYIAYIEMPDVQATKIVKIAIVQEQQILDRY